MLFRQRCEHVVPRCVLVRKGTEHSGLDLPDERGQAVPGVEVDAQRDGVHERPDHQLRRRIGASGQRCGDDDRALVGVGAHSRREGREQHRVQRRLLVHGQRPRRGRNRRRKLEGELVSESVRLTGTRVVGG